MTRSLLFESLVAISVLASGCGDDASTNEASAAAAGTMSGGTGGAAATGGAGAMTGSGGSSGSAGAGGVPSGPLAPAAYWKLENLAGKYVGGVAVADDGTLSALPGAPWSTGDDLEINDAWGEGHSIAVDADHHRLFAVNRQSYASFSIGDDGALTAISKKGDGSIHELIGAALVADGRFLIAIDNDQNQLDVLPVGPDGALSSVSSFVATGVSGGPRAAVPSKDGKFLYVAIQNGGVLTYAVGADGTLTELPSSPLLLPDVSLSMYSLYITAAGDRLYALDGDGVLWAFDVDGATGELSVAAGAPFAVSKPQGMAVAHDGKRLFLGDADGGNTTIAVYDVDPSGTPVAIAGSPFHFPGTLVAGLDLTSDDALLLATTYSSEEILSFSVDAAGTPTFVQQIAMPVAPGGPPASGLVVTR